MQLFRFRREGLFLNGIMVQLDWHGWNQYGRNKADRTIFCAIYHVTTENPAMSRFLLKSGSNLMVGLLFDGVFLEIFGRKQLGFNQFLRRKLRCDRIACGNSFLIMLCSKRKPGIGFLVVFFDAFPFVIHAA